jgi:hypothetical protein
VGRGPAAAAISPTRGGPRSRSSRRCEAASPSGGRPAGSGGGRERLPQSARGLPGSPAQPGASPTEPGAGAGTPRGTRRRASPGAPCRCRGEAGLGVAEVEPPPLPVRVVGRHRAGYVVVLAGAPHGERHAAGAHRLKQ